MSGKTEGTASIGAMALAFLASQHHNIHMVLLTLGLGGSGMTFLQVYPGIRRGMLLASLVVVALNLRSLKRRPMTSVMRRLVVIFSVLTAALVVWSLARFGI
jgi:hypothetical protein